MTLFLTVLHVMVCVFLVVIVLLQRGKGAEIGAVFGGGSGQTIFGSRGAGNFLTKLTTGAAVVFMITSLSLAYFGQKGSSLLDDDAPAQEAPASPFAEPKPEAPAEGAPAATGGGFEEVPADAAKSAPVEAPKPAPDAAGKTAPAEPEKAPPSTP
jgi:preprotein translocase subunit SecG